MGGDTKSNWRGKEEVTKEEKERDLISAIEILIVVERLNSIYLKRKTREEKQLIWDRALYDNRDP